MRKMMWLTLLCGLGVVLCGCPPGRELSIGWYGEGTVEPSAAVETWVVRMGRNVNASATAAAGWQFHRWTGDTDAIASGETTDPAITVSVDRDTDLTAHFVVDPLAYRLRGLNFSPYLLGDTPDWGPPVSRERITTLLEIVAPYTEWIRTHGATHGLEHVPEIAQEEGVKVAAAAWLDSDLTTNEAEIASLIDLIEAGHVDMAIVGTEVLYRGDLSPDKLLGYIQQVKGTGVATTTNDTWYELSQHPEVMAECDVVMANFYPYWEGEHIDEAVKSLHNQYQLLEQKAGGKEVIVGETGWPSDGEAIGEAEPSPANAAYFFLNFVSWAQAEEVDYFYFAAFDEEWKDEEEGPQGAHWGIWEVPSVEGITMKDGMDCVFAGDTIPDNWTNDSVEPEIDFTYVPPIGSFDNLQGQVSGVEPAEYRVAVFIKVDDNWWSKPYWDAPLTSIEPDGSWVCDITTGDGDERATRVAAFLVPADYDPPQVGPDQELPAELYEHSLDYIKTGRIP